MDQSQLEAALVDLSLGAVRYFDRLGSTNDEAARWAVEGAPDLALVVADEQTAGRGRAGRHWYTPPGVALAFSLVLYPTCADDPLISRMTALGALAVCETLRNHYDLPAQIKWPNDVLLDRRKVAGVLVEAQWTGESLNSFILGIGINVAPASVYGARAHAEAHAAELRFPATCVESALRRPVDRLELLHSVLVELLRWRSCLAESAFIRTWEANLAFRGEWVHVTCEEPWEQDGITLAVEKQSLPTPEGQVMGLSGDGSLQLRTRSGEVVTLQVGEVRLQPMEAAVGP
jgi:BirA family biotin operon repressor/biotin-[acetyl-CoA-carboxylase] ligase